MSEPSAREGGVTAKAGDPHLSLIGVSKYFGRVRALRDISLSFREGECVGLVGDNGAGKSTLVRILGGQYRPDIGTLALEGQPLDHWSTAAAQRTGIASVPQDLKLCDELDVGSNIFLNDEMTKWRLGPFGWIDKRGMAEESNRLLGLLGASIPASSTRVERLSGGQRQAIAIARALRSSPRLLLLDEPTAALGVKQSHAVLETIRRLSSQGIGVILISHNIEQVLDVCDRLVCLFQGSLMLDAPVTSLDRQQILAAMMGSQS